MYNLQIAAGELFVITYINIYSSYKEAFFFLMFVDFWRAA